MSCWLMLVSFLCKKDNSNNLNYLYCKQDGHNSIIADTLKCYTIQCTHFCVPLLLSLPAFVLAAYSKTSSVVTALQAWS